MTIKTLPELVKIMEKYKNPYILTKYKGLDWASYTTFRYDNIYKLDLSKNLSLVSLQKNKNYKINKNEFIYMLEGRLLIDDYKTCYSYFMKESNKYSLCKGIDIYNTFLHYYK